jgi:hypothetical protein
MRAAAAAQRSSSSSTSSSTRGGAYACAASPHGGRRARQLPCARAQGQQVGAGQEPGWQQQWQQKQGDKKQPQGQLQQKQQQVQQQVQQGQQQQQPQQQHGEEKQQQQQQQKQQQQQQQPQQHGEKQQQQQQQQQNQQQQEQHRQQEQPHVSVLLQEILDLLAPVDLKVYVDCTLGAGGHATEIAAAHPEMSTLVGIDMDPNAHTIAQARIAAATSNRPALSTYFAHSNYCEIESVLKQAPGASLHGKVDGMLMDLGVSSMQLDQAERGFSFMRDGPIDMRMDPGEEPFEGQQLLAPL